MPPIFANDMVLQRSKPVKVWGKGVVGDTITVSFAGNSVQTTVAVEDWSVMLPSMPANATGQTLTVAGSASTKTYTDVLVGEVWLAGGQSNMSWNISQEIDSNTYDTQERDFSPRRRRAPPRGIRPPRVRGRRF